MIRFIILFIVGYVLYRAVKNWMSPTSGRRAVSSREVGRIDDEMVKDPYCETYFPRREGVRLEIGGEDLLFCSAECRDRYLADREGEEDPD
jgi:hypothetical protein